MEIQRNVFPVSSLPLCKHITLYLLIENTCIEFKDQANCNYSALKWFNDGLKD